MKVHVTQNFDRLARKAVQRELQLDHVATGQDCLEWLRRNVDHAFVTMLEEYDTVQILGREPPDLPY